MKSLIALSLTAFLIGFGCTSDRFRGTIEMETYYLAFDGIKIPNNHQRRAFLEIPKDLIPSMSYGRSVFVYFENSDGALTPSRIDTTSPNEGNSEPYLDMNYLGYDADSVSGKFGTTLEPISSFTHNKTAMEKGKAKLIVVEFSYVRDGKLEFTALQLTKKINKRPLFLK